jgi:hypothetical protein
LIADVAFLELFFDHADPFALPVAHVRLKLTCDGNADKHGDRERRER